MMPMPVMMAMADRGMIIVIVIVIVIMVMVIGTGMTLRVLMFVLMRVDFSHRGCQSPSPWLLPLGWALRPVSRKGGRSKNNRPVMEMMGEFGAATQNNRGVAFGVMSAGPDRFRPCRCLLVTAAGFF
jgi:hypothetical protein